MYKKLLALLLVGVLCLGLLAACGDTDNEPGTDVEPVTTGGTLESVEGFAYATLDPHKDYNSWHSQKYGLTESLFKLSDDMEVEPWLAESLDVVENVGTLTLKDGVAFSNGTPLTAEMVKRNLLRLAENNKRFKYILDFQMEATDDKTLVITTPSVLPTLKNELANAEVCMLDLDATTDFDNNPISTGPFVVDAFVPEGDITLIRNENYWDGDVNLESITFYSMRDAQSKLMAMQNGEINVYDSLSATDIEIFAATPDDYQLFSVPSQARTYMFLNPDRVAESVRQAIMLIVDRESIAAFTGGTLSPAYGVYSEVAAYGKSQVPMMDLEEAKAILEADGYTLNGNNVYEKDGVAIPTIGLSCYAARSIDTMAVLIQEQLAAAGIPSEVKLVEDPDGSYMTDKNYDICFYRMTTDKTADPMTFIDGVIKTGSYQDITAYGNAASDAEIETLRYTVDPAERAELANKIVADYFDSSVFCPLVSYNRTIVMRTGVSNFSETNPYEFYAVNAKTTSAAK